MTDWRGYRTYRVMELDLSGNAINRESASRYRDDRPQPFTTRGRCVYRWLRDSHILTAW